MARVKLDENVPDAVAGVLRNDGHDVSLAREEGLSGATDDELLESARTEGRVLMTLDLDFADVVRPIRPPLRESWCFVRTSRYSR